MESCLFDGIDNSIPNALSRITHGDKRPFFYLSDIAKLHTNPVIVRTYQWRGWWFKKWKKTSRVKPIDAERAFKLYVTAPSVFARSQNVEVTRYDVKSIIDFAIIESIKPEAVTK